MLPLKPHSLFRCRSSACSHRSLYLYFPLISTFHCHSSAHFHKPTSSFQMPQQCLLPLALQCIVDVEGEECVHAKISQAGGGELNVEAIRYPKNMDDPLVPF
ncbi:putative cystatin-A-like protein [Labeo rohita]|uniref:Putative cystatin-A-like protein n=1 Tax=Labeo rohita TaxID=84645 RepID=A0A498LZS3_LABRO|nr:putative cystatin-A-like protein [Labeo rohita]